MCISVYDSNMFIFGKYVVSIVVMLRSFRSGVLHHAISFVEMAHKTAQMKTDRNPNATNTWYSKTNDPRIEMVWHA